MLIFLHLLLGLFAVVITALFVCLIYTGFSGDSKAKRRAARLFSNCFVMSDVLYDSVLNSLIIVSMSEGNEQMYYNERLDVVVLKSTDPEIKPLQIGFLNQDKELPYVTRLFINGVQFVMTKEQSVIITGIVGSLRINSTIKNGK